MFIAAPTYNISIRSGMTADMPLLPELERRLQAAFSINMPLLTELSRMSCDMEFPAAWEHLIDFLDSPNPGDWKESGAWRRIHHPNQSVVFAAAGKLYRLTPKLQPLNRAPLSAVHSRSRPLA